MDTLRVRAYNVRFGDAILVSVPDRNASQETITRHILIDLGNVLAGSGGVDAVFEPVVADILGELNGQPLDLYVMTHEHMDHVQGPLWLKQKRSIDLKATHAWLTASAAPDYYDQHPEAKRKRLELEQIFLRISTFLAAAPEASSPATQALMFNNNPRSTGDCVEFLRGVGRTTTYVFRGVELADRHPFDETRFEIWSPEEDTSIYYGRFRPMGLGVADSGESGEFQVGALKPPRGVDAGAFFNLVEKRLRGVFDNLLAIDKAANNTSLVFSLEWRGWRLLFPGDAEHRAWLEMNKRDLLKPVHFLKVGHHGSWNGTPPPELLEQVLPLPTPDGRQRRALVSTHEGTYAGVPNRETLDELRRRCDDVISIGEPDDALFVDIHFPEQP
jgi:beta-lactamase superfamily II metal-dependent hydrolase